MTTSLRSFRIEMYEEHLEEASFLYVQRRALALREDIPWFRVADFDERLEAHIDAIVAGGELGLEVCVRRAVAGDTGELFAAMTVFCRFAEAALFAKVLRSLDYGDAERVRAVSDALKAELPESWCEPCMQALANGSDGLVSLLATVIGHRRLAHAAALLPVLLRAGAAAQPALLWSIGRTRSGGAIEVVRARLQSPAPGVRAAAILSGLRLQDGRVAEQLLALEGNAHPIEAALAGGRSLAPVLIAALRGQQVGVEVVVALGLLGDLTAVRPLIDALRVEPLAAHAARALFVITGAGLYQDVTLQDQVSEDELFEHELDEFRKTGLAPRRGDGEQFGERIKQLSIDPQAWTDWLQQNRDHFSANHRYRLGRLFDPGILCKCLRSASYPKLYRALALEELLIRYGHDLRLELDMPVAQQVAILRQATHSIAEHSEGIQAGCWYLAGRRL